MSFKSIEKKIAKKQGIPTQNAGAILANSTRNASAAAKQKNPNLLNVKPAKSFHATAVLKIIGKKHS